MRVLLAGATGLVGSRVLERALASGVEVIPIGRRATGRVADEIVCDFDALPPLPAADAALCALGTTRAAAGSKAAFRAVDHDAVLAFAYAALEARVERFVVVTAAGADARAPVFYSRVKGEVEGALAGLGFARLDILQPGLLLGRRVERRPVEALLQRLAPLLRRVPKGSLAVYDAIEADTVAAAMLALAARRDAGVFRHTGQDIGAAADRWHAASGALQSDGNLT